MSTNAISEKQQFEELITSLCNSWVQMKMIEHDYMPEMLLPEVNRFFDMPLRAIYNLVTKNYIAAYDETGSRLIEKDALIKHLQSRIDEVRADKQSDNFSRDSDIADDATEKTPIRKWIHEKYDEQKQMSVRLYNVLNENARHLGYLEYIDKQSFLQCRNAGEKTWQEFVTIRGY